MQEIPPDVGRVLERLRNDSKQKQSAIAERIGVHPSRISRIETGVAVPSAEEITGYLDALGSDAAKLYRDILATNWSTISRPLPWHPNARDLVTAAGQLARLDDELVDDPNLPQALAGQAKFFRDRLIASANFLADTTHRLAFIGKIGDGKTTAVCFLAGLTRPSTKQPRDLRDECLLATQRSRTTLCEVVVQGEPGTAGAANIRYRLTIEPLPNEEIYRLVKEFCADVWSRRDGGARPSEESRGLSIEVERALRNMAGLKTQSVKLEGGRVENRHEEDEIARTAGSPEELQAIVAERLRLFSRSDRELVWTGSDDRSGRDWLKKTFAAVNLGNLPTVSLPARITVTVPFAIVPGTPFEFEARDTKGIDGSSVRPDIQAVLDDRRCVPVLCTTLGDAPGPHYDPLFEQQDEMGSLKQLGERAVLLILDKDNEALSVADDSTGQDVETVEAGRAIKEDHARRELERRKLAQLPILFFNAASDPPKVASGQLASRIVHLRQRELDRLRRLGEAAESLIENREQAAAAADLTEAVRHLQSVIQRFQTLSPRVRPYYDALLRQVQSKWTHPRSVLASVNRAGSWWNFDVFHAIGAGAAEDANLRIREALNAVRTAVQNLAADDRYQSCRGFLVALEESVQAWTEDFLGRARTIAAEVTRPVLSEAGPLWAACETDFGRGFKGRVHDHLRKWFEEDAPASMHATLEERLQLAWTTSFVRPLEAALGEAAPRNDEFAEH